MNRISEMTPVTKRLEVEKEKRLKRDVWIGQLDIQFGCNRICQLAD